MDKAFDNNGTTNRAIGVTPLSRGRFDAATILLHWLTVLLFLPLFASALLLHGGVGSDRAMLLDILCDSGSNLVILPVQDVFGWQARINQPATVSDSNWTWKLPWPSDRLLSEPEALAVAEYLRQCAARHGRYSPAPSGD